MTSEKVITSPELRYQTFARCILQGMTQSAAYIETYHPDSTPETIRANAARLITNATVQAIISDAKRKVQRATVADFRERQERLTTFMRADLTDFVDSEGNVKLSKDTPHHQAISEYIVTSRADTDGAVTTRTSIKLRDPIASIDTLNKMDRIYAQEPLREVNTNNTLVFILPGGGKVPAPSLNALAVSSDNNPCPIDDALNNQGVVLPAEVVEGNENGKQGNP